MQCILDLFEYRRVLSNTHAKKLLRSPVLVEEVVGILPELFHVCTNEHLAKFDEVAVFFVIDFDNTPRILASTNLTAVGCINELVGADNCERNLAGNFLCFGDGLFVFIIISGCLEDVNVMMLDVRQNLQDRRSKMTSE